MVVVNDVDKENIKRVIEFANDHPYDEEKLCDFEKDKPDSFKNHYVLLSSGFLCCYTIEEQMAGLCRHLSVTKKDDSGYPSADDFALIAQAFEIESIVFNAFIYFSQDKKAVNVLAPFLKDYPDYAIKD